MQPPPPPPPPRGPCWPRRFLGRLALVALLQGSLGYCPLPLNPTGTKRKDLGPLRNFPIGMVIRYECDIGYKRVPGTNNSIRCDVNSQWTQPEEFCKESCPLPPQLYGARLQSEYQLLEYFPPGFRVKYDCLPGFQIIPFRDNSLQCSNQFRWTLSNLFCKGYCPLPPTPEHAKRKDFGPLTKFPIGMVIQYDCDRGHKRVPHISNSIRCDVNSQWTQPKEFCKESCPLPPKLYGARLQKEFQGIEYFPPSFTVKYECLPGYRTIPFSYNTLFCGSSFRWAIADRFCEAGCPPPPVVRYATLQPQFQMRNYFSPGTAAIYDCIAGYGPVPGTKTSVICLKPFQWSNPEIVCKESCPLPPTLMDAKLQEEFVRLKYFPLWAVVKYDCIGQYKNDPQMKNFIHCRTNFQWSQPEVFCKESCPLPPKAKNAKLKKEFQSLQYFPVGSVVKYDCSEGYQYTSGTDNSVHCSNGWKWSKPGEFCDEVECDDATIEYGVKLTGFKAKHNYGDDIAFKCNNGYFMIGSYLIQCGDNSTWKPEVPSCKKINAKFCGVPLVPSGSVYPLQPQYERGTRVVIECNPQYSFPDGTMEMRLVCHGHNLWQPPAQLCVFRTSPDTSVLTIYHGRIVHGKKELYKPGDKVTVKCHPGYSLKGSSEVRYIGAKKWSPTIPYCSLSFFFILLITALVFFILLVLAKRFNQIYSQERESTPWT